MAVLLRFSVLMLGLVGFGSVLGAKDSKSLPQKTRHELQDAIAIEGIDISADKSYTTITLQLSKEYPYSLPEIEDHGSFLQITLKKTITPNPGSFYEGKGPYILKLASFQPQALEASLRIFVNQNAHIIKKATLLDRLEKNIVLSVDHRAVADAVKTLNQATTSPQVKEPATSSTPNNITEQASSKDAKSSDIFSRFGDKLTLMAVYMAILLFLLVSFFVLRPRINRLARQRQQKTDAPLIQVVASHVLANRHKLQVVEVMHQKVLLAVGPDKVEFLTHLSTPSTTKPVASLPPNNFQSHLYGPSSKESSGTNYNIAARQQASRVISKIVDKTQPAAAKASSKPRAAQKQAQHNNDQPVRDVADIRKESSLTDIKSLIREKLKQLPTV